MRSPKLVAEICRLIAEGKSLRFVCDLKGMPDRETIRRWLDEDADFRGQYARAREAQADFFHDDVVEKADAALGQSAAAVQAHRLAVDARKWVAAKLRPRKYGDRSDQGAITLQLPSDMSSAAGIAAAADAILRATCAGDITPTEAAALAGILETRRRAIETEDLGRRLAALEEKKS